MKTPLLAHDEERLEALRRYQVLDRPSDDPLDSLVLMAARACDCPIAVVCFVGRNQQWFASHVGLDLDPENAHLPFCFYAILQSDALIVADAIQDERFADNAAVTGGPRIRAFAGAPLITPDGYAIGALCAMDGRPRDFSDEQIDVLKGLAHQIMALLELRRQLLELHGTPPEAGESPIAPWNSPYEPAHGIIEGSRVAMVLIDPASGAFVHANSAACDLLERFLPSLKGSTLSDLPLLAPARVAGELREALSSGGRHFLFRYRRSTGDIRDIEAYVTALEVDGGPRLSCILHDVTERKRAEDERARYIMEQAARAEAEAARERITDILESITTERKRAAEELRRRADELVEADRRKDQFLALLGHELRNPLGPILNALYLLKIQDDPAIQDRARAVIDRQVHHMARLIDDLLDVSRIARGKIDLHPQRIDLARLIRTATEDHRRVLEEKGLSVTVDLPDEPLRVEGDPTRMAQVLGNLLQNASRFTDPGGCVTVRAWDEPEEGRAQVSVTDTGIGIEPALLPTIFDAFSQADLDIGRSRGGLGLGLALVKGLVELHHGGVGVASDGPGHGAEFKFWLPLAG